MAGKNKIPLIFLIILSLNILIPMVYSEENVSNESVNSTIYQEDTDLNSCKQFVLDNPSLEIKNSDDFCSDDPNLANPYEEFLLKKDTGKSMFSAQSYQTASFCQTCNANSYESNEGPCACGNDEECTEEYTKSTVYARDTSACFMSCDYQEATDYCKDSKTVMEAFLDCYCCDEVKWTEYTCPTNYACNDGKCIYSPEGTINSAYWSNNEAVNGETIKLNVETSNFNNGQQVTFKIYEDDVFSDDLITTKTTTISNNKASVDWIASLLSELYPNNPEYFFKVFIDNKEISSSVIPYRLGHGNYDCEPEASQKCSSSLVCDGNTGWTDLEDEGCCYNYENWNAENDFCNQAIVGKVYSVTTNADGSSQENYYSNKKLLFRFADEKWLLSCGVIDAVVNLDNYGEFKLNPEQYVSSWNNNIACAWTIKSVYVIDGSEIVGSLSNNFNNGWLFGDDSYKDGKRFIKQYIRVHTDKPSWKGNALSISSASMKSSSTNEEINAPEVNLKTLSEISSISNTSNDSPSLSSVRWKGNLLIEEDNSYYILPKISGGFRLYLDEKLIADDWDNNKNETDKVIKETLKSGEYNLTIEYYNLDDKNTPILMWKTDQTNFEPIPSKNLKRISLEMERYKQEGTSLKVSSLNLESLSQYSNNYNDFQISFIEEPNQLKNLKNPVILVHGLNGESGYWISDNMDQKLSSYNYDAWSFYYPNNQEINYSSALLADGINFIKQKTGKTKVSILSHSMGGLVSRGYIENQAVTPSGIKINYRDDVEKFITLGSPFFGSHLSNKIVFDHWYDFTEELARFLGADTTAPAYRDLSVGSQFTWKLNKEFNSTSTKYYNIVGTGDNIIPVPFEDYDSDSLVAVSSANLYYKGATMITFDINHANLKGERAPPQGWLVSYNTDRIIAITADILNGASESTINSHLNSLDGELYLKKDSIYSDSMPFSRGSILIKMPSQLNVNSVSLMQGSSTYHLVVNPNTGIWYHFDNNILCISNCGLSLPSGNYQIYLNGNYSGKDISIRPAETVLYEFTICTPNILNTTLSNWQNISCLPSKLMNQSRFLVQYDSNKCGIITNKTIYEYRAILPCGTLDNNQTNTTTESLTLINPIPGIYSERGIPFNIISTTKFAKLVYSDNGGRESTLCTNCFGYSRPKTLGEGNHTLFFRGLTSEGKNMTNQTKLFIDSTDPQISTIKPASRKYTNGSDFYIKYTENNCQTLKILINNQEIYSDQCQSGKNIEKVIPLDISQFNGQEVEYKFTILDIANNIDESRLTTIKVDTTAPEIKDFKAPIAGKYVSFNMTILNEDKNSFNKVEYIESGLRPQSLCTSLKNNNCFKKVYFKAGTHNLIVRATDDAGNSDTETLSFTIA